MQLRSIFGFACCLMPTPACAIPTPSGSDRIDPSIIPHLGVAHNHIVFYPTRCTTPANPIQQPIAKMGLGTECTLPHYGHQQLHSPGSAAARLCSEVSKEVHIASNYTRCTVSVHLQSVCDSGWCISKATVGTQHAPLLIDTPAMPLRAMMFPCTCPCTPLSITHMLLLQWSSQEQSPRSILQIGQSYKLCCFQLQHWSANGRRFQSQYCQTFGSHRLEWVGTWDSEDFALPKLKSKGAQAVLSDTTSTGCIECECKLQANSYPSNCAAPATVSITHLEAHQWVLPSALPLDLLISKQESHQYCSQ